MKYLLIIGLILLFSSAYGAGKKVMDGNLDADDFNHKYNNTGAIVELGCYGAILSFVTGGDANGETIDSIAINLLRVSAQTDILVGVFNYDFDSALAFATQDAKLTISVNDTGRHVITGFTNNYNLENYTRYKFILSHNLNNSNPADTVLAMPMRDAPSTPEIQWSKFWRDGVGGSPGKCLGEDNLYIDTLPAPEYFDTLSCVACTEFQSDGLEWAPFEIYHSLAGADAGVSITQTFTEIASDSFMADVSWTGTMDSVMLIGHQVQNWVNEKFTYSFSIEGVDSTQVKRTFETSGEDTVFKFSHSPEHVFSDDGWWADVTPGTGADTQGYYSVHAGVPFWFTAYGFFNDLPIFIDSPTVVRIHNLYTVAETDTIADSCILFGDEKSSSNFINPVQGDSIIIKLNDTLHTRRRFITRAGNYNRTDTFPNIFAGAKDTTFAHLDIESGGIMKMHGGTRINILTYDIDGGVVMTATDTVSVWSDGSLIDFVGKFPPTSVRLRGFK